MYEQVDQTFIESQQAKIAKVGRKATELFAEASLGGAMGSGAVIALASEHYPAAAGFAIVSAGAFYAGERALGKIVSLQYEIGRVDQMLVDSEPPEEEYAVLP